jgi:transcriptional regulator with XRE-family HTH domain
MTISPAQCRAGRALIDWKQPVLAEKAGLGLSTIVDFEHKRRAVSAEAVVAIERALQRAGVEFITRQGAAGVMLKTSK